ncbi:hypothetical protein VRHSUH09_06550 [Veillonella rogosae JCM 15642]|jgi:hypothetical protein|uniref:DUF2577 domain-containing protein n=1 Tax=Veillonella rogosae JCM 15642 TaxID=1298595 RepID=A0ABX5BZI6_9FIRM|nr:DUF2577 domain-containing protein [Veillonella rogosae]DAN67471.1 MAG TPA: Protein of unknown function (DUF2577) [Caudoviricetes sp.]PQL12074.1 hypothetical protein VRHSUH09_06550 [Veillonella rogosae JCM 15642]DAT07781.1 MAG TPA: Protein of unknown function (DUF2577) [Caudoviricetes sp.]DAU61348.1 MAG TPA: Protein of unknown function (DUF2577) [Caudoviricetes sp.]DAW68405.1 MAG TPA: Protein of unknown function (DUF2577) [Caudoviricetes sp.]
MNNDYNKILNLFKEIATNTIDSAVPVSILIGSVTQVNPLVISLGANLPIPEERIVLTKNTCEWTMEMSVDHITENRSGGGGYAEFASHNHEYKGRKKYLVHNQLQVGDKVLLIQETGGQRYIALDRLYNPNVGCTTK